MSRGDQYKNPALRKEYGVLKGYCVDCGALIGDEYSMSWYALIRRQRCDPCTAARRMECDRLRHQRHRQGIRAERREMRVQLDQLRAITKCQRDLLRRYRAELDYIKNGSR